MLIYKVRFFSNCVVEENFVCVSECGYRGFVVCDFSRNVFCYI